MFKSVKFNIGLTTQNTVKWYYSVYSEQYLPFVIKFRPHEF